MALNPGEKAPSFKLATDGGGSISLTELKGRPFVLYFYPKDDTTGCTKEAIDFTRLESAFAASGTAIIGISADSLKAQESFRDKHNLAVPLISDERHEMLEAYGAWRFRHNGRGSIRPDKPCDAEWRSLHPARRCDRYFGAKSFRHDR